MTNPSGPDDDPAGPFPIDPRDLLRHAAAVADTLPGRTDTDYRRAVSAAYYALYHALTLQAAALLATGGEPSGWYDAVRRFRHWHLRDVARAVIDGDAPGDGQVERIVRILRFLRIEREHADYNHRERFTQRRAHDAIGAAIAAVEAVTAPAFAEGDGGQSLLRQFAAQPDAP